MQTLTYPHHAVHLDPMTGVGLLVLPHDLDDVQDPMSPCESLHSSGWDAVVRDLGAIGWEPLDDDDAGLMHEGSTPDGRDVVALYGRDPIVSTPSVAEMTQARARLCALAGIEA